MSSPALYSGMGRPSLRLIKTIAGQRKTRFRGRDRVGWAFTFAAAAYNLVRLPRLPVETG